MFRKFLTLLAVLTLCTLASGTSTGGAAQTDPREIAAFIKRLAPLRTYETFPFTDAEYLEIARGDVAFKGREVPGSDLLEGAVGKIVSAPAWKIWRAVVDEEHHREYMPQIRFSTVLQGQATGRMIFDFLEIPLLSDRQWVVQAKHWGQLWKQSEGRLWLATFATPANQQALIDAGLKSGRIPADIKELEDDTVTIRESRASYTLIELPDGRTLLEYRAFSDPAGKIPSRILNYGAPSTMKKLVSVLEGRAQQADAHFARPGHPVIYDPLDRPMGTSAPARN